ncbi:hypothetical protein RB195_007397 [Necator americanus]|uniref:Mos1 transposase HTH domain-containing protein n=1 Tax=Necator americanus TaxID=51031 RepID=A0ABR1C0V8_NECAM
MRLENHTHIRHIMLYHYEKGWIAAQSFRDLNEHFVKGTITDSAVRKWFIRFKSDDTIYDDLDDLVADIKAWIASKNRDFFARGIDRLPGKWEAVLEVDGDYALE